MIIRTYNCVYCYSSNIQAMCLVDGYTTFKCKNCFKSFSKNTGKKKDKILKGKHRLLKR